MRDVVIVVPTDGISSLLFCGNLEHFLLWRALRLHFLSLEQQVKERRN